jgi:plastocyanin
MEGRFGEQPGRRGTVRKTSLALAAAAFAAIAMPSGASAAETTVTKDFKLPSVGGFSVDQAIKGNPFGEGAPRPPESGHITEMSVDLYDGPASDPESEPIPISRLMLHHIVFLNTGRPDQSCTSIAGFDGQTVPAVERFFAAGEERAKMKLPPGYGYDLANSDAAPDKWLVLYMVMNHQRTAETDAWVRYTMKVDDSPAIEDVVPWWLDAANCSADPIYNVKGDGKQGSESARSTGFSLDQNLLGASGGRIVAAGGHVHGGAYQLDLTRPACETEPFFSSVPKWGGPDHPFYTVRPILHEPGPVNMSAFTSAQGYPIRAGQQVRFDSVYDDSQPHTRVMGISVAYVARDPSVQACGPDPTDVQTFGPDPPSDDYRDDPIPFTIPLVTEDTSDPLGYEEINKPPGKLKRVKSGTEIKVTNANELPKPNMKIDKGDKLKWEFTNSNTNLHNITLANGPEAIGSPNLSLDEYGQPRVFDKRFRKPGTYKLFCALHPTLMHERVVVKK